HPGRSTRRRPRRIPRQDARRVRLFPRRDDADGHRKRVREVGRRHRALPHAHAAVPARGRVRLRAAGRPLRAQVAADDRSGVLLGGRGAHGPGAELRHVPGAAGTVWDRHGRRVGRGRVAGDGEGPSALPRRGVRTAAAGLCAGIPAGGGLLPRGVPTLGMAPALLHRRPAGAVGAVRTGARGRGGDHPHLGVRADADPALDRRVHHAVLRPGRVGGDPRAPERALARCSAGVPAGLRLSVRRSHREPDPPHAGVVRHGHELRASHGALRGHRVHPRCRGRGARTRAPGSGIRARGPVALGIMATFIKATQAYQQGQRTLPRRYYVDAGVYAEEQERIFARRWVCVGRAAELGAPGEYVVRAIAGESVILVRGQDGAVRAFYNVCRHRGTRLCDGARGRLSETIQCPYHAWTYTLDGALIGAPHMNEVAGFDKRDYPLHPVALAAWEGFLFVNLARDPEPFARAFAPIE